MIIGSTARCYVLGSTARCYVLGSTARCYVLGSTARCYVLGSTARCYVLGSTARCYLLGMLYTRWMTPWKDHSLHFLRTRCFLITRGLHCIPVVINIVIWFITRIVGLQVAFQIWWCFELIKCSNFQQPACFSVVVRGWWYWLPSDSVWAD